MLKNKNLNSYTRRIEVQCQNINSFRIGTGYFNYTPPIGINQPQKMEGKKTTTGRLRFHSYLTFRIQRKWEGDSVNWIFSHKNVSSVLWDKSLNSWTQATTSLMLLNQLANVRIPVNHLSRYDCITKANATSKKKKKKPTTKNLSVSCTPSGV